MTFSAGCVKILYLETILRLSFDKPSVHAVDVGRELGYSKPSVSRAVSVLKEDGYLTVGDDGALILTDSGREIAEKIYEKHTVISEFLKKLGVPEETAVTDACKIEHIISEETFSAVKKFLCNT